MTTAARLLAEEILPAIAKVAKEAITGGYSLCTEEGSL
jgi:hypothetical protein